MPLGSSAGQVRSGPRGTLQLASVAAGRLRLGDHRRVEVLLVPELRAERILLKHVHVVEALGREIALIFDQRVVGSVHIGESGAARRLDAFGPRLGDLRFGQAEHAAGARPGVAAERRTSRPRPWCRAAAA